MTEPNQVRPVMQIVDLVRQLIEDAHYSGKADGVPAGRKQVVDWVEANTTEDEFGFRSFNNTRQWQAKLKDWGIE